MEIATLTDVEILVKTRFDFFEEEGSTPASNRETIEATLRNYFREHNGKDFIAIAVMEGNEVASVGYLLISEKPVSRNAPNGRFGTLLNILTYPPYRSKGYGTILIEALKKEAIDRGLSRIDLYSTEQGIALYEKTGFSPVKYEAMRLKL